MRTALLPLSAILTLVSTAACLPARIDPSAGVTIPSVGAPVAPSTGSSVGTTGVVSSTPLPAGARIVPAGSSIQAAVDAAKAGDTIVVQGAHLESVRLRTGITLRGDTGASISSPLGPIKIEDVGGVTIDGLRLERTPSGGDYVGAVRLKNTTATIKNCEVISSDWGIVAFGTGTVEIDGCHVHDCGYQGIEITGQATGYITNSTSDDNVHNGIAVGYSGLARITGCRFERNGDGGIAYADDSNGYAENNLLVANKTFGIMVRVNATPRLTRNTVVDSKTYGILVVDLATPTLDRNVVTGSVYGVSSRVGGTTTVVTPTLTHNLVSGNSNANYDGITPGSSDSQASIQFLDRLQYILPAIGAGGSPDYGWTGSLTPRS